ncbi:MAG TPA: DUF6600 domain-containing protein [Pyrinomonadaceae bacterium]|jgi:hypothetical protein|nr:DUF6600 domain-containing protein [Pyrinomonadaceae bacterium]
MSRIKLWPHGAIIAVVVAVVAGLGVWLYANHEQTAEAEALPYVARIQRVEGEVAFCGDENNDAKSQWTAATANQPFSEGDRIYTRDKSRTSLAFSGRNFARLDPNTSLDVVSLEDRRTQLALRDGSAMFDVGYLQPDELFEVATPNGAIDFAQPGLYHVGFDQNGGVLVSVLSGLARVVGQTGSGEINKGEMLTLLGQTATELALSKLNRQDAGYQVDEYYRYQYPNSYDGRYSNYDTYLNDPSYYDPYQRQVSYKYASSNIPGLNDLDSYGDWQNVGSYGYAWRPRVDAGWAPYQQGQWTSRNTFGPTWVSSEPWGYAPYHYGRWANVSNQWYWIPDRANTTPSYAPALVAFVSGDNNQMGWVPLGPGDAYAPRYYDANWQPRYLTRNNVVPAQLVNFSVPGAVTVVPVDAWGRPIDRRTLQRIDQQRLASMRSTLDPLTLTPLRNAVVHSAWGRGKIDLPLGIAKKLYDTRVFVGNDVRESRFRQDRGQAMRVERISEQARNQKFKVRDERQQERQADTGRRLDMGRVNGEANKDNKAAEKQARQLEQQQRKDQRDQEKAARAETRDQDKAQRKAEKQAQGERVGKPAKSEAKPHPTGAPKERKPSDQPGNQGHQGKGGGGKGKGNGKKP